MTEARIQLPDKLAPVFAKERGALRYRGAFGGRGSGKSFGFAKMAVIWGYCEPLRILCTREYLESIKESFHAELKRAIEREEWLKDAYDVGESYIRGKNGTEFVFKGLQKMGSIKSMSAIDLCIVEEAEDVRAACWHELPQTIRADKSEIWCIWNPKREGSPVDERFRKNVDDEMHIVEVNYTDNPFFTKALESERLRDLRNLNESMYRHIWLGSYLPAIEGAIYQAQVEAIIRDGRFRTVPYDPMFPVHTCWDLGGTTNTRVAMVQKVASEIRIIDHFGGGCSTLSDVVKDLQARDYRWGIDFIPHDGAHDNMHTGKSTREMLQQLGRNVQVLHRTPDVGASIRATAEMMSRIYIDKDKCNAWFESIKNYRHKFDRVSGKFLDVPLHDDNSHDADTLRYVSEAETFMTNDDFGKSKLNYTSLGY